MSVHDRSTYDILYDQLVNPKDLLKQRNDERRPINWITKVFINDMFLLLTHYYVGVTSREKGRDVDSSPSSGTPSPSSFVLGCVYWSTPVRWRPGVSVSGVGLTGVEWDEIVKQSDTKLRRDRFSFPQI